MTCRRSLQRRASAWVAEVNYWTVTRWTVAVIVIAVAIGLMLDPG